MTDQTETARQLLWRHNLPEDVIDGALCLHAQELAAVQRKAHDKRRPHFHMGLPCTPSFGCHVAELIDLIDPAAVLEGARLHDPAAPAVPAGQAPATGRPGTRFGPGEGVHGRDPYYATDRAAVLREAAERVLNADHLPFVSPMGRKDVATLLRRMAETPAAVSAVPGQTDNETADEARCSCGGTFPLRHLHADTHQPAAFGAGLAEQSTPKADPKEVVHGCPPDGSGLTPCCGRTPFELPLGDRISSEAPVTCPGPEQPAAGAQQPKEARPALPCNWARIRQQHTPHDWEPQPGMDPVHCPGFAHEQQPKEA